MQLLDDRGVIGGAPTLENLRAGGCGDAAGAQVVFHGNGHPRQGAHCGRRAASARGGQQQGGPAKQLFQAQDHHRVAERGDLALQAKARRIDEPQQVERKRRIALEQLFDFRRAALAAHQIDKLNDRCNEDETDIIDKIALRQVMDTLKPREKQIIILRYFKEKTQVQIAKMLGISQVQVSRIEKKILEEIRDRIGQN